MKYRIRPKYDRYATIFELHVKRWYGWKFLEQGKESQLDATIEHMNKPARYIKTNE